MDEMLRDHKYAEEIEQLKTKDEADEDERSTDEGEGGVSMDGLEMIKRLFQYKRWQGDGAAGGDPNSPNSSSAAEGEEGMAQESAAPAAKAQPLEPADMRVQAGCTAVVAVKFGNDLFVANAGDSRGVLCRSGQAVALSEDHKPAAESERTRILNAGGLKLLLRMELTWSHVHSLPALTQQQCTAPNGVSCGIFGVCAACN